MTANKPMTGEQLDELMTVAVNMQRDSEKANDRPAAMFAYAVQVAVLELRNVRNDAVVLEQKLAESQREFRAADATFENLQMQAEKLAAENAGLIEQAEEVYSAGYNHGHLNTVDGIAYADCVKDDFYGLAVELMREAETPVTDAFLAEVRAHVWIEGNEPAEFGRYWVRYETDVGPQYCSAKWMEHNFCAGSDTNIHKIWLADHSRSINSLKGVTHYTMLPEPIEGGAK